MFFGKGKQFICETRGLEPCYPKGSSRCTNVLTDGTATSLTRDSRSKQLWTFDRHHTRTGAKGGTPLALWGRNSALASIGDVETASFARLAEPDKPTPSRQWPRTLRCGLHDRVSGKPGPSYKQVIRQTNGREEHFLGGNRLPRGARTYMIVGPLWPPCLSYQTRSAVWRTSN